MVGQHETEWWVNMIRNLTHGSFVVLFYPAIRDLLVRHIYVEL